MRLLIVLPGALGDVVRGLPLLGRLRRGLRSAHIGWAVEAPSAPLLADHPWIDTLHVLERPAALRGVVRACREIRAARYEIAIDLGRGARSALVARASGAPRRLGFDRADAREGSWLAATEHVPPQGVERSKLEQFLAVAEHLDVAPGPVEFGIAPGGAERAIATELLEGLSPPIVIASVGSSCSSRRWWPDATAAVLDTLASERGASTVLTGTRADAEFGDAVAGAMRTRARNLIGRTSLRELVAVLARARIVFGPDSGALHLAAALAVPVVSLWGATSAIRSTPWGQAWGVVVGRASCSPCFLRECPIGRVCMRAVTPEVVGDRIESVLAA
jgi:lipopolysaccharide heptosyltransferase II